MPDFPRRSADGRPLPAAIASALVVHAAGLGALIAFGYGTPALPAPEAVVEVAMVPEPTLPEPALPEPPPAEATPVAEPVIPMAPQPPDVPVPAIAEVEGPVPDVAPEPAAPEPEAPVPPPVELATLPDPAPPTPPSPPAPVPPIRPPARHAQHTVLAAPRSAAVQQEGAATAAPSDPAATPASALANQEAAFEARIRDAVQAAVRYPPAARMMGVTGRARVQFDYRSGAVAEPVLAQSSGTPMLDKAALAAARAAHYPPAPASIERRPLRLLVWVEFRLG